MIPSVARAWLCVLLCTTAFLNSRGSNATSTTGNTDTVRPGAWTSYRTHVLVKNWEQSLVMGLDGGLHENATALAAAHEASNDTGIFRFVPVAQYLAHREALRALPCSLAANADCIEESTKDSLVNWSNDSRTAMLALVSSQILTSRTAAAHRRLSGVTSWTELNAVLSGTMLNLPDISFSKKVGWWTLNVVVTDLRCGDLSIHEDFTMSTAHTVRGNAGETKTVTVRLAGVALKCSASYRGTYMTSAMTQTGTVSVAADRSSLDASVPFQTNDKPFKVRPPVSIGKCDVRSGIKLQDPKFSGNGNLLSRLGVINWFKGEIRKLVEPAANDAVADLLRKHIDEDLNKYVRILADDVFEPFYAAAASEPKPLHLEPLNDVLDSADFVALGRFFAVDPLCGPNMCRDRGFDPDACGCGVCGSVVGSCSWSCAVMGASDDALKKCPAGSPDITGGDDSTQTTLQSLLGKGMVALNDMLGTRYEKEGRMDLGVNHILREHAIPKVESMIPGVLAGLNPVVSWHNPLTHIDMSISKISFAGLDTVHEAYPLAPARQGTRRGERTLATLFRLHSLDFTAELDVTLGPSSSTSLVHTSPRKIVRETITVAGQLTGLDFDLATYVAVPESGLMAIKVGSLFATPDDCLLASVKDVTLTHTGIRVSDMATPKVLGFISSGVDKLTYELLNALFALYEGGVLAALPSGLNVHVKPLVNQVIDNIMQDRACHPPALAEDALDLVDFQNFPLQDSALFNLVKAQIPDKSEWVTYLPIPDTPLELPTELDIRVDTALGIDKSRAKTLKLDIYIGNAQLSGLHLIDTTDPATALVDPIGAQTLRNRLMLAGPVVFVVPLKIRVQDEAEESFDFTLELKNARLAFDLMAKLRQSNLLHFPVGKLLNPNCLIGLVDEVVITDLLLGLGSVAAGINCNNCTSKILHSWSDTLGTEAATAVVTQQTQRRVDWLVQAFGDVTEKMAKFIATARSECAAGRSETIMDFRLGKEEEEEEASSSSSSSTQTERQGPSTFSRVLSAASANAEIVGAAAGAVVILLCCFCCRRCVLRQRSMIEQEEALPKQPSAAAGSKNKLVHRSPLIRSSSSLAGSGHVIPLAMRLLLPLLLCGNAALFALGHLEDSARVSLMLQLIDGKVENPAFSRLSMVSTVSMLWEGKIYGMAVLVIVVALAWPYVKLVTSLALWFLPPTVVNPYTRGSVLRWLDALGKWSMFDIYCLIVFVIVFRVDIKTADSPVLPDNLYNVRLSIVPVWGIFYNAMAQVVSQLLSHAIMYYHNRVVDAAEKVTGHRLAPFGVMQQSRLEKLEAEAVHAQGVDSATARSVLAAHTFEAPMGHDLFRVSRCGRAVVTAFLATVPVMLFFGVFYPSFNLDLVGVFALLFEAGTPGVMKRQYSLPQITQDLMAQAIPENRVGVYGLAWFFLVTAAVVPLCQALNLLVLWTFPLTLRQQVRQLSVHNILNAWQFLEVYVIAVTVASLQLGGLSGGMFDGACRGLDQYFRVMSDSLELFDVTHARCLKITAHFNWFGTGMLLGAAFSLFVGSQVVASAAAAAVRDRAARQRKERVVRHVSKFRRCFAPLFRCLCLLNKVPRHRTSTVPAAADCPPPSLERRDFGEDDMTMSTLARTITRRDSIGPAAISVLQTEKGRGVVRYSFYAEGNDELSLQPGDVLEEILPSSEPGWSVGRSSDGTRGIFPSNYVDATTTTVTTSSADRSACARPTPPIKTTTQSSRVRRRSSVTSLRRANK